MTICPVCGGTPVLCKAISSLVEGTDCFSLCCGIGSHIIENWDVLKALPEIHQQIAIEQSRQERADYHARAIAAIEWLKLQPITELPPDCRKE